VGGIGCWSGWHWPPDSDSRGRYCPPPRLFDLICRNRRAATAWERPRCISSTARERIRWHRRPGPANWCGCGTAPPGPLHATAPGRPDRRTAQRRNRRRLPRGPADVPLTRPAGSARGPHRPVLLFSPALGTSSNPPLKTSPTRSRGRPALPVYRLGGDGLVAQDRHVDSVRVVDRWLGLAEVGQFLGDLADPLLRPGQLAHAQRLQHAVDPAQLGLADREQVLVVQAEQAG
jgi:hypothetical protein